MALNVDLEAMVSSAGRVAVQGEDLAAGHLATDNRMASAQVGWQGLSATAMNAKLAAWGSASAALLERISDECYYLVVSAYDWAALARGEHRLLWHTKLSACSRGLSQAETIPALLASGAGVFGKDMTEAELFTNRGH